MSYHQDRGVLYRAFQAYRRAAAHGETEPPQPSRARSLILTHDGHDYAVLADAHQILAIYQVGGRAQRLEPETPLFHAIAQRC